MLQGFGAAGVMSVNLALVRFIYPRDQLGRGVGLNALVVAVSAALGPTVASAILSVGPWQWLFAVNVPLGVLALVAARTLPRTARSERRFDAASALLNALTFALLIVAIDGIGHRQAGAAIAAEFAAATAIGVLLVYRALARPSPLFPVDLLRIPIFALSVATSVCSFVAQMLAYVSLPFFFQGVLSRSQVATGLLMTPWPLTTALMAPLAGRLSDRYPAGILSAIGLAVLAGGLVLLAVLPAHASAFDIIWRMAVCGGGFGLFQSPNNRTMITAAPRSRSGGASGMLGTARLLGQTTGAASAALVFGRFPDRSATVALVSGACFAATAALISVLRLTRKGRGGATPGGTRPAS
jgi:DHA2 family multidrug resistance protein-like MFS transporter